MNNLMRISARRLFKSKIFILMLAAVLLYSLYYINVYAAEMAEWAAEGEEYNLEDCYYNLLPLLGLAFGTFIPLFAGTEYSDGTIRNKLIAGHSRKTVFLSIFLTAAGGCLILTLVWMAASLFGLRFFAGFGFGWSMYLQYALVSLCSAFLYAAIYSTISLLIPNKAVSAVTSLLLWFLLLASGSAICNALAIPPTAFTYVNVDGRYLPTEEYPNPYYIGGLKRQLFECLCHILPTCQAIKMADAELEAPFTEIAWTLGITAVFLAAGCTAFKKKDMK